LAYTFRGGTHVKEYKYTAKSPIERMPQPETVSIPLSQHIGQACHPLVKIGDAVLKGQIIGDVDEGALGCPVHSSVSGTVKAIEEFATHSGPKNTRVIIENDGQDTLSPDIVPFEKPIKDATPDEIIEVVRRAGISGMGGATFPTHAKIKTALGKVDYLIVNCAECEPFITANHRLLLENAKAVVGGAKILLKAFSLSLGHIAVEDNKFDAIKELDNCIADSKLLKVCVMKTKYPQGDERQLIYAVTGREVPAGKLPADVGCVVFNAETCAAIYNAFATGMPLIERIVTVSGDCINNPKNILVPIGTSYKDLIDFCGGLKKTPRKIINGGPMMGVAQWDIDTPITKGTSAVLAFSVKMHLKYEQPEACIRCGRCVGVCPMHLMPNFIAAYYKKGDLESSEKYGALACVECGSCSYICPALVPIVQYIKAAKGEINAAKKLQIKK